MTSPDPIEAQLEKVAGLLGAAYEKRWGTVPEYAPGRDVHDWQESMPAFQASSALDRAVAAITAYPQLKGGKIAIIANCSAYTVTHARKAIRSRNASQSHTEASTRQEATEPTHGAQ